MLNQERVVRVFNDGQEAATVEVVETIPTGEGWNLEVTPTMGAFGTWKRRGALAQCHSAASRLLGG